MANQYGPDYMAFTTNGKTLLTCERDWDGQISAFDPVSGKELGKRGKVQDDIGVFALSRDGKLVASQGNGGGVLQLLDVASGKQVRQFGRPMEPILSIDFSPDGKTLAEASDWNLRVWDVTAGKVLHRFEISLRGGCTFSPDGTLLAAADTQSNQVHLWQTSTWKKLRVIESASALRQQPGFFAR